MATHLSLTHTTANRLWTFYNLFNFQQQGLSHAKNEKWDIWAPVSIYLINAGTRECIEDLDLRVIQFGEGEREFGQKVWCPFTQKTAPAVTCSLRP